MTKNGECKYCNGKGYFQLILGGSETCEHCHGSGWLPLTTSVERKTEIEPVTLIAR